MNYTNNYTPENLLLMTIFGAHALSQVIACAVEQKTQKTVARMRGIREAISVLKETDFDTAITYGFIRKLIDNKELNAVRAGKKILINLDELIAYLNTGWRI
jgi:excisionase family DNA binding protein